eukprot:14033777-Alexandrium_andersonii.AAC.1
MSAMSGGGFTGLCFFGISGPLSLTGSGGSGIFGVCGRGVRACTGVNSAWALCCPHERQLRHAAFQCHWPHALQ